MATRKKLIIKTKQDLAMILYMVLGTAIMRTIAILIMKMMLTKAKNDKAGQHNSIVKQAFDSMIQNYEDTIRFLKADR